MTKPERKLSEAEIAFVKEQARLLAADLSWHARGPVRLHLIGGDAYAFTFDAGGDGHVIDVYLNPGVLFDIRNRDRAIAVWYGMGFHELAHHLWRKEQYDQAIKERFKDLFNLLDDEQNERRGRARDPEWGKYFQTTVAWVFRKKRTRDKGYTARWNEFAYHFRRNLPMGVTDPVVTEALGLIPRNFKDLSKEELLVLTRKVHETLARGVDVPETVVQEEEKEEKKPEPPKPAEPEKKPAPRGPVWKVLTKSKWSWIFLAVCVIGWTLLFTRKGLSGYDETAGGVLVTAVLIAAFVALMIWLDKKQRDAAVTPAAPKPPGKLAKVGQAAFDGIKARWKRAREVGARVLERILHPLDTLAKLTPAPVARFFGAIAEWVWRVARGAWGWMGRAWKAAVRFYYAARRTVKAVWRSTIFRTILASAPIAFILVMIIAVIVKMNWKLLIILLLLLLLLGLLAWLFRKRIKQFLQAKMEGDKPEEARKRKREYDEVLEFRVIENIVPVEADQQQLDMLLPDVLPLAQQMRRYFEQCGLVIVDKDDQEQGYDVGDDFAKVALGETNIFVDEEKKPRASVHIEVGIDCSGSMATNNKILLAKRFGLLVEESVRGVRGISCNLWGFTDTKIYDCGTPGQGRVSGLTAGGGNNDSAMLWHMYNSALASGKELRILLMVSDGMPTECTWSSLNNLVLRLDGHGFVPVQIAVDKIDDPAFQRYFVDLAGQPMASAIIEFGRMLLSLVDEGM